MSAPAAAEAFDLLAQAAIDRGWDGEGLAIGMHPGGSLVGIVLMPGEPCAAGCLFTRDVFGSPDAASIVDHAVEQLAREVAAALTVPRDVEAADEAWDTVRELIPFLQHAPGCPTIRRNDDYPDEYGDELACLCGLSAQLDSLRDEHRIDVARCRGCGRHAVTPDGTEDWAWREDPDGPIPYCHECAVALGA